MLLAVLHLFLSLLSVVNVGNKEPTCAFGGLLAAETAEKPVQAMRLGELGTVGVVPLDYGRCTDIDRRPVSGACYLSTRSTSPSRCP